MEPEWLTRFFAVLKEAYEGPKGPDSYFTDNNPDAGLFGTLAGLNAEDASHVIGGSTVAAHVHHVIFAMKASTAWIRGDRSEFVWKESWRVSVVDSDQWRSMQARLREAYATLCAAIKDKAAGDPEAMGGAFGALAHSAYHLGAVRHKVMVLRAAGSL